MGIGAKEQALGQGARRYYTPRTFLRATLDLLVHGPALLRTLRAGRVSHAWAETIMLAVTGVNRCRYCAYLHTRLALRPGVAEAEIAALLDQSGAAGPAEQQVAVLFAQHYAATGGHPDPGAVHDLIAVYGPQMGEDMRNYVRIIQWANLAGNTVDELADRIRRRVGRGFLESHER